MATDFATPPEHPIRKIFSFLGLKRSMVGMLGMCILIGLGEKMAERFLPIYLIALGGGAWSVGLLNSLDNLLSALYSFPGGWLADRLGTRRSLLIFNLVAMAGYLIVILVPSIWAVFLGSLLFISWTALSLPATMSLISDVLPREKRTMGVSIHSLIRRIPMALGPVMGGILITRYGPEAGVRYAFIGALFMAVIAILFQEGMIEEKSSPQVPSKEEGVDPGLPLIGPELRRLLVADILVRFCEQIPYPFVVLWCMNIRGISGTEFGLLTTVEMVTAMLIYIPVAWLADRSGKKPFVVMTFGFFTIFPLALMCSTTFWPMVLAFIVRGLKEFGEPTRKALIMDLAPEGRKAAAFGTYYLWRDIIVAIGALTGAFLWSIKPEVNLIGASLFGLAGTIWFAVAGSDLPMARSGDRGPENPPVRGGEGQGKDVPDLPSGRSGWWLTIFMLGILHLGAWMHAESLIQTSWKSRVDLLLDSLSTSADQTLQAGHYLEERVGAKLKTVAAEVIRRSEVRSSQALGELCRKHDLKTIALYDGNGHLVAASDETGLAPELPKDFGCHELLHGEKSEHLFGFSQGIFCEADVFGYASRLPEGGLVRVLADVGFVLGFERQAGLPALVERFRKHPDILTLNLVDLNGRSLLPGGAFLTAMASGQIFWKDLTLHGKPAARFELVIDDQPLQSLRQTTMLVLLASFTLGVLAVILWFRRAARLEDMRERGRQLQELERQSESLARVVASVAHEIRNPLNTLALGLESLRDGDSPGSSLAPERRQARLELLQKTVGDANRLVIDLLQTTRPVLPVSTVFLMRDWAEELRLAFETGFPGCRLTIDDHDGAGSTASVETDQSILRRLVWNLLANAAQAGAQNVFCLLEWSKETVTVHVEDDGPGLPESVREHLFMPGNTTREEGSGLGLYNARRSAVALGGRLELAFSRPGRTKFSLILPKKYQEKSE